VNNKIFFTPGPSQLYPGIEKHIASALENNVGAISHRSKQFQELYKNTTENLRHLLQLPEEFHIFYLASATEIWERIIQNCVEKASFHCVNGSFSKRFCEFSTELGKKAFKAEVTFGNGFYPAEVHVPEEAEAICLTHNETSSGVSMPVGDINKFQEKNKNALVFVDGVSSLPYPELDYSKIDSTFFSVQKCFGLPAGLGIWIVNERCIEKSRQLQTKGIKTGTYHTLPALLEKGMVNQTPETPNAFTIYLLGKICEDMNHKGIATIRKEIDKKADLIYTFLSNSENFDTFVKDHTHRSKTTIVANTKISSPEINKRLEPFNTVIGTGYGSYKEKQVRIANFPAHSVESIETLIENLKKTGL